MASSIKKSALSLDSENKQERSNSYTSCQTNATLASVTANTIDFWNRLSQQMSYIDGSTHSSSIGETHQRRRRSSANDGSEQRSLILGVNQRATCPTSSDTQSASIDRNRDDAHFRDVDMPSYYPSGPILKTHNNSINEDFQEDFASDKHRFTNNTNETNTSASWTNCACSYSSAITNSMDQTPPDSPLLIRGRSVSCNQNEVTQKYFISYNDLSRTSLPEDSSPHHQCANVFFNREQHDRRLPHWQSTVRRSKDYFAKPTNLCQNQESVYQNFLNDNCGADADNDDDEDGEEKEDLEMELLQPLTGSLGKNCQIVGQNHPRNVQIPLSASVGMDSSSIGESRRVTPKRMNTRHFNSHRTTAANIDGHFYTNNPSTFACYGSYGLSKKKASSWEESETLQRRRSLMLAASLEQCPAGVTGLPPGMILLPTPSQLDLLDKRDLRYYFQHPYPRLFVTYFVIFCNFLLFAEDPISHSHTESDIPMVGNVFSFVVTKYPPEWRWTVIKVLMWILAMLCGMIAGKLLIHGYLCGRLLRLKMFRDDQGSWMTMFMTVIVSLYLFSHAYNLMLLFWYHDSQYLITSEMRVTNSSVMKAAACGTWLGDLITALMVTDMMLQDNLYPNWATWFRKIWRKSNIPRILIFWVGSVLATSVVVTLIVSDWISWDKLNKDFISTNEISRAFLASFILVMDLLIVMQDWDFPNFTTTLHVNLPGMNVATLQWKYAEVDITGKWFNYGIIFLVMMLDLNMWKNQIFYNPKDYGQYTGPDDKVRTINEYEVIHGNATFWTWDSRSSHFNITTGRFDYEDDMQMNSRYMGYPLSAKWTAFIPSVIGLCMLITLVTLYGRFPSNQSHPRDRPADQCRDIDGKQQDLL